ncbi:putative P-loop containing nucleoside triphosphate hydrolase, leucine-rich repeat domain superfamily [Helianthus annuus]|nr:putative P-loop containing nucleoside triphosphate hydrolase, leucine-rich repeat domain superfamily [Helianthus annuus]
MGIASHIVTERSTLFDPQVQPKYTKVLLNGLCEAESLELLCIHTFKSKKPKEGYKEVSEKLVKYCDGHPFALEVLGKSLRKCEDIDEWEYYIEALKKEPHSRIKKTLQMSFDSLSFDNDKDLFKHIACFFVGMDKDLTERILNSCDIKTRPGIRNLTNRCLLSIGRDNKLMMHQLVQEMGRDLVRQESPYKPWKRSRLWCHVESFKVLKHKKGKRNLLGLALDTRMLEKKLCGSFKLKKDSLRKMDNLTLLQLNYVQLNGCFRTFPEGLRWLCMHGFPLKSIPLDLPMENLVALDLSYSNIEYFDMSYSNPQPPAKRQKFVRSCSKGKRLLGSLKVLDLSFCEQLHSLGGFFELPELERLIVVSCISLIVVCESVDQCVELVHIDLSYCYKLKKLPISLGKLKKVQTLFLDGCNFCESKIEMWDTNSSDFSISSQTSSSTIIDAIPSDFKFFVTSLPSSLIVLSLANSNLSNESFPRDFSCLSMLEDLCLDDNPIVSMPNCVRSLPRLKILSMKYCEMVISIEHPPYTLRVLSVGHRNTSLQKIKFDEKMSPLNIDGPWKLLSPLSYEIDGMVKIQPLACVEKKVLRSLGWTNLDELIKERHLETCTFAESDKSQTKMYYEFGIFSTMYHEDKGMPNWIRCRSKGPSISFTIPSSPKKLRGLNFYCMETMRQFSYDTFVLPKIKISNITKNHTWIYNHYIDKVKVGGKYLTLLSHWMFGPNEMTVGDQITIVVSQRYCNEQLTKKCGVNVVYDDGKIEEEEDALRYYKSWNHIIGGDLSAFQYPTGEYFLSNMHFFDGSRYREKEVTFQAFSQKKSKILGHESQDIPKCNEMKGVIAMHEDICVEIGT